MIINSQRAVTSQAALRKENELHNIETLMSSNSDEWATPEKLFDDLNEEFHFTLDPCSTDLNFKCEKHFTLENDGLSQNWGGTEYSAIHLIVRLINGLKRLLEKPGTIIHWLSCCYLVGQIQDTFTTTFIREQRYDLSKVG